jgi:NADPH2:quinone reductase
MAIMAPTRRKGPLSEVQQNRVIRLRSFGDAGGLEVADAPMRRPGKGEVRVRVLASGLEYTDVIIRRHVYPQTWLVRPPFVMGYDVVGEIEEVGAGVKEFQVGDRVADMTVLGSNALYRTLRAKDLTRVPASVDPAEAATLILSWMTAYQLLHRAAHVRPGQRVLVLGAAGAVGQALLVLGKIAGLKLWGSTRPENAELVRELGATWVDSRRDEPGMQGRFDVVFDAIADDGFRRSLAVLKTGGQLVAYGYSAAVQQRRSLLTILGWIARLYTFKWGAGRRGFFYSINLMRALHPAWFRQDLESLFALLSTGAIRPRVAERLAFEAVAEAHRRIETGGLQGKLVLCPGLAPAHGRAVASEPATRVM